MIERANQKECGLIDFHAASRLKSKFCVKRARATPLAKNALLSTAYVLATAVSRKYGTKQKLPLMCFAPLVDF